MLYSRRCQVRLTTNFSRAERKSHMDRMVIVSTYELASSAADKLCQREKEGRRRHRGFDGYSEALAAFKAVAEPLVVGSDGKGPDIKNVMHVEPVVKHEGDLFFIKKVNLFSTAFTWNQSPRFALDSRPDLRPPHRTGTDLEEAGLPSRGSGEQANGPGPLHLAEIAGSALTLAKGLRHGRLVMASISTKEDRYRIGIIMEGNRGRALESSIVIDPTTAPKFLKLFNEAIEKPTE